MRLAIGAVAFALTIVACSSTSEPGTTVSSPSTSTSTVPASTVSGVVDAPCSGPDDAFRGVGLLGTAGSEGGDARQITGLRWAPHDGCERFVVDLASTDGAPATSSGPVAAEMLAAGVIRITLPPVIGLTAVADAAFEGELADRAFVVRDFPGTLLVDLHISSNSEARISSLDSPARIVVDVKPSEGEGTFSTPTIGSNVVVFEPSSGAGKYPIRVSGYSRTFESTVVTRLFAANEVAFETFTTATDYLDAWGRFTMEIPDGPRGRVDVFVGEDSAATGEPLGVTIELLIP